MPPSHRSDKGYPAPNMSDVPAAVPIKAGVATVCVPSADIRLVVACQNYTRVSVLGRPPCLVRRTMQQWVSLLPSGQFVRIHRGVLLNVDAVDRVERLSREVTRLHFLAGSPEPIDVKRRHWPALRTKLEDWRKRRRGPTGLADDKASDRAAGSPLPRAIDAEALRLVLEARHFWSLRTSDGLARGDAAARQALRIEPRFAAAHAVLADIGVVRAMYRLADGGLDVADDLEQAESEARAALALNPALAEPHATLGFACLHAGRFSEMEPHFQRALRADPKYPTGYQFYAWGLAAQGRIELALEIYARAIALDPLSFINLDRYGAMLALGGRPADALAANERAAALRPDVFVGNLSQRAPLLWAFGRRDEAIRVARQVRQIAPGATYRRTSDADAIFVLKQAGLDAEADAYGAEVLARLEPQNYLRSFVLAALGRPAEAIGAANHLPAIMLPFLYWSATWAAARTHAGFAGLIATLGRSAEYRIASAAARVQQDRGRRA